LVFLCIAAAPDSGVWFICMIDPHFLAEVPYILEGFVYGLLIVLHHRALSISHQALLWESNLKVTPGLFCNPPKVTASVIS
jgi:hypothetical protein